jgi:hypothetical protein
VHRGFKIFNFRDKKVTKIFSKNEKYDNIVKEIQAVRWASKLEFAPKIDQSDTEKRWYEEEFIIGKPCYYLGTTSETKAFQNIYPKHVVPCLEKMILLKRPLFVKTKDYVHRTAKILSDPKLKTKEINNSRLTLILNFISNLKEQICNEGNFKIPLVFSHGDFSLVNILKTKTGIKVIDWEAASIRNPLNDLYNYFFTELYYKRAVNGLAQDVENAILILQKRLCVRAPELWKNLVELSEFYRRLYYLERICLLLERKLTDKVIDVILRSIEIFKYYEKLKI